MVVQFNMAHLNGKIYERTLILGKPVSAADSHLPDV